MVNKAIVVGHLGRAPETRFLQNGTATCSFSVATTEKWKDKDGQPQEKTEWHKVVVWGKQAEHCGQYLDKGRLVYVEGSIQTRQYDDKDGNKRSVTEIKAREVRFLGGRGDSSGSARHNDSAIALPPGEDATAPDDQIPW